jgi:hypothetical protein
LESLAVIITGSKSRSFVVELARIYTICVEAAYHQGMRIGIGASLGRQDSWIALEEDVDLKR